MVIGFSLNNSAGSIQLFCKYNPCHDMRECHTGEGEGVVSAEEDIFTDTVCSSDKKDNSFSSTTILLLNKGGKID